MYDEINQNKFVLDCEHYIEENVAAPYIAFYLARDSSLDTLGIASLRQHFNSAADVFNSDFENTDKIIADIKLILKEKYLLEIIEENPLKLKEI
ncbi:MAG: hypothetical protein ACOX1E_00955 [Erysipelotrichaceae bacterium]|jgi:hypothetical protein